MAQANFGLSESYAQAEIDNHVGKLASLRGVYPTTHRISMLPTSTPQWCGGKLVCTFPAEQAHSEVFHIDFPLR